MSAKTKSRPQRKKLLVILGILAGILVLAGGWFYFQPRMPHPLGDKLEYIGKRDYGCSGFWLCDSKPGTTYIYTTNLTPPELVDHFKKGQAVHSTSQVERWENRGESFDIELLNTESTERFFIFFEARPNQEFKTDFGPVQITEKYVVRIDSVYYKIAKDSL